ncbi:hypothetical protein [Roseisolibacter agri]|uniref:Carboxypeptidase regulatory-like domain-containing protein n=1 Tax=Roseisolibacter agri TaxID=2014610 RepID=A0AA37Q8B1_9BACT|nr:hypothetical protein [Roseisolibacter agri]GLC26542.1 hypothetical protein rosag_30550 [Roseisolibacter agri]
MRAAATLVAPLLVALAPPVLRAQDAPRAAVRDSARESGVSSGEGLVDRPVTLPDGSRRVLGRVLLVRDTTERPVPGAWVTLHRVGSDGAGPLDSTRTQGDGGFTFRYRPTGAPDALYFASTSYGGIAYFTSPLRDAESRGEAAEISVFDTTSRAIPITVRGRHLIVSAPVADGSRNVIEVFELTNDTSFTAVPPTDGARGTWSVALPRGAADFAVRRGEVPDDGMSAVGGRAVLLTPFGPGIKQVAFTYRLPSDAFPLRLALERPVTVLEVLLEDPRGSATGAGIVPVDPVALEGRTFRRFLAQDVKEGATVDVAMPVTARRWDRVVLPVLLVTMGGAMVLLLLRATRRQPTGAHVPLAAASVAPPRAPATDDDERERLLAALAALDDDFAARGDATAEQRAAYDVERAALKARLAARLAAAPAAR